MSIDLKDEGVTSVLLHPGWVRTNMTRGASPGVDCAHLPCHIFRSWQMPQDPAFMHVNAERAASNPQHAGPCVLLFDSLMCSALLQHFPRLVCHQTSCGGASR